MTAQDLTALIIGGVSVLGGLTIGGIAVAVSVPWSMKEKIAKQEAASKERLALIEKGYDPEQVFKHKKGVGSDPLLWGCLLAGLGLGVLVGYILSKVNAWDEKVMTNAVGIGLGGVGLVVYHFYSKRSNNQTPG
jgi:hypothetical protein